MSDAKLITMRMAEYASVQIRERGSDAVTTVDDFLGQCRTFDRARRFDDAAMTLVQADAGPHANSA